MELKQYRAFIYTHIYIYVTAPETVKNTLVIIIARKLKNNTATYIQVFSY